MPATQRAYTLRLSPVSRDRKAIQESSRCIWETHRAVNAGTQAFGDWLLTFRGGLDHSLADGIVRTRKGEQPPTAAERRNRRIVLALSWLSVESLAGAPARYTVAHNATVEAFCAILERRGLAALEIASWLEDCTVSLQATTRPDAVWVNRSAAFDDATRRLGSSLTRAEIWDLLGPFFTDTQSYLAFGEPAPGQEGEDTEANNVGPKVDKTKDLVQKAGQWLSSRFGSGPGADFNSMSRVYAAMATWAAEGPGPLPHERFTSELCHVLAGFEPAPEDIRGILKLISGPGYKSATRNLITKYSKQAVISPLDLVDLAERAAADGWSCTEKVGRKGSRQWADTLIHEVEETCGFTYLGPEGEAARHSEFAVMLDHAARRVSATHSWIKRAAVRRLQFLADTVRLQRVHAAPRSWLDAFCAERTESSGALEPYRIRRRAYQGWGRVVEEWAAPACRTEQDRVTAARNLQGELEKFGDIQLFEALAVDDAVCVWKDGATPNPQILLDYAAAVEADHNQRRFKIPAYCHPDPLLHPVFCDFGNSRWDIKFAVHKDPAKNRRHLVNMRLFTGGGFQDKTLLWHSKRLPGDLAMDSCEGTGTKHIEVTRADRLGRAAAGAMGSASVKIAGLFEEKYWNGRLQAPREDLRAVAAVRDNPSLDTDTKRQLVQSYLVRVGWSLTLSARLQPNGPWIDYAAANGLNAKSPHRDENKNRAGQAKLLLCRLPGLRVLSVDLGHRYAAACTVWQAVPAEEVNTACAAAGVQPPAQDALYLHLKISDKTTIYRRTSQDMWARLGRQFLIKLPGEDTDVRKASPAEFNEVIDLERDLGYAINDQPAQVDNLMKHALQILWLGLRRHASAARIASNLTATHAHLPGGRAVPLSPDERVEVLVNTLIEWHRLAGNTRWKSPWAERAWAEHIAPLLGGAVLPDLSRAESPQARRAAERGLRTTLNPVAEHLAAQDLAHVQQEWGCQWHAEDRTWRCRLRWIKHWIMPRGKGADDTGIRHIGGLSLTRLENVRALYQLQKAFFTRLTPNSSDAPRTAADRFGQGILDALEHLRENRVKQLSSRIVAAALGLTKDLKHHLAGERYAPCHAIVIENLGEYSPDQARSRPENRQLMSWCAAQVSNYLRDECELYGLYLREVSPAYTSRQDSRTGAPGIRCQDVPTSEFLDPVGFRAREILAARKKCHGPNGDLRAQYLVEIHEFLQPAGRRTAKWAVRIPQRGGDIFVSSDSTSPIANGLQADLNAAANIGLKALLDPDWPGKWWYVPCDAGTLEPLDEKTNGSTAVPSKALRAPSAAAAAGRKDRPVNMWSDISDSALGTREWMRYSTYQEVVERRVISLLRTQFRARCSRLEPGDEPF